MLQEIKNLPSLIQERWLERGVSSAIKESQLKASKIEGRFTNVPYPLVLTYNEHVMNMSCYKSCLPLRFPNKIPEL